MRLRVKVDVRQPLKKNTKVKNKEGGWCEVQFKYEKLGIFCFVCGIMGHAENKCEVRFAMEEDDGVRGWSNEIRAEPRRQGGRLVSRWLREEKGGKEEHGGGDRAPLPQSPRTPSRRGPITADVEPGTRSTSSANYDPNKTKELTWPAQSMHNYSSQTNQLTPIITNHCGPSNNANSKMPTHAEVSQIKNDLIPSFALADNLKVPVTPIYDTWTNKNTRPINLTNPETENNQMQLIPNQSLTFSSQPITKASLTFTQASKKNTRGPNIKLLARTKNNPTQTRTNLPNPQNIQPRPDLKKLKLNLPAPNPTQDPNVPVSKPVMEDMEVQGEKKRRREDDKLQENSEEIEHFLTAGPGSQDCRDQ
jgi:hypothetical protein